MPAQNASSPSAKRLSSSKLKSTIKVPRDINALANKSDEEVQKKDSAEDQEYFGNEPFTFEELKKHWQAFASQKEAEGKNFEHMVLQQEIYLKDTTTIVIKFTNPVKIDILDKFRADLITYLKTKLNNGKISLEIEMIEEEAKRKMYTNSDKFNYLAEKNPIVKQLRDRLGLDPDF